MSTVQIKGSTTQGLRNTRSASVLRRPCSAGECGASGTRTTSAMTANAMHAATTSTQYACCQVMTLRSMRAAGSANTKDALKPSATFDMAEAAREAGVRFVTGDTKVVNRGHGDGIYINTSGVGALAEGVNLGGAQIRPGDAVLVSGTLGDHGITIMSCREGLNFSANIESDAAPLNHLIADVLAAAPHTRCFRDPTRGGIASTLNELAEQSGTDITVDEDAIPVKDAVLGACEMLGYDVMQVANEGKMVCVVAADEAEAALAAMRKSPYGDDAAIIGRVTEADPARGPKVFLRTAFGSTRILDMLVGEQLPRIC